MLAAAVVVPLAGCTGSSREPSPVPPVPPAPLAPVGADLALHAAAVERERELLAAYDQALAGDPARRALLRPLRAAHVEHLVALEAARPSASATPSPAAPSTAAPSTVTPSARPSAGASPAPRREGRRVTLADLRSVERRAAAAHAADALPASRALAQVLATLAAAEASHAVALA